MPSFKSPLEPNSHSSPVPGTPRELQRLDRGVPAIRRLRPLPDAGVKPNPRDEVWAAILASQVDHFWPGRARVCLGIRFNHPAKTRLSSEDHFELEGLNENFLNFKNVDETERPSSDTASLQTQIKIG